MDDLPDLLPGSFTLLLAPQPLRSRLATALAARLALGGPLRVLDGGNRFDAYGLARLLRRCTPALPAALQRVQVARAFTCHQMAALLAGGEAIPGVPILALDLLATFLDENVPLDERLHLLGLCTARLHRLAQAAPLLVSSAPPPGDEPSGELYARLEQAAGRVWRLELPAAPQQPRLF
jgi:hypothetical protein